MTFMLERFNSEDDTDRIEKLEAELKQVRNAFEEYIATTEGLEGDVNAELKEMQDKLNRSATANLDLMSRMKDMQRMLENVEQSSEETKSRLRAEAKLRRQAERSVLEAKIELNARSGARNYDSLRIADSGVLTEMMSNTAKGSSEREVETLMEELLSTQRKLKSAETQLEQSQTLVKDLERNLHQIGGDNTTRQFSGDDSALLRELDEIRAEIDAARGEIQSQSTSSEYSGNQASRYESKLKESREENQRLSDEITCLRNILYDQEATEDREGVDGTTRMSTKDKLLEETKKMHEKQMTALRDEYELTLNDNMDLQEKVKKLEMANAAEKKKLTMAIQNQEKEADAQSDSEEISTDDIIGVKFANDASTTEDMVREDKLKQTEQKLRESQKECSEMRSEILGLTESLYFAQRGRSADDMLRRAQGGSSQTLQGALLEVEHKKKQILRLQNTLNARQEEIRLLSEEMSHMTSSFEKAQNEYNAVVEELGAVQEMYNKSRQDSEFVSLKSQFKKLSAKNESLARQVKDMKKLVASTSRKQEAARSEVMIAEDLKAEVYRVVDETDKKNHEVDELTLMVEDRINLAERNVEILERRIAQIESNRKDSESVTKHSTSSRQWLVKQYKSERDEKVKAAISATMTYLAAAEETSTPMNPLVDDDDKLLDEILSVRTVEGTKLKSEPVVETNPFEEAFQASPRLLEISRSLEKLSKLTNTSEDDRTIDTSASHSSNSQSMKANTKTTKHAEIIQELRHDVIPPIAEDKHEVEIRGEITVEERE